VGGSAGNNFTKRGIKPGDVAYIVTLIDGQLYLGGRMTIDSILGHEAAVEFFDNENIYDAEEHLIGIEGTGTPLHLYRRLAPALTKQLLFKTKKGPRGAFFVTEDELDNQATRGVRELMPESAVLLDRIIELTDAWPQSRKLLTVTEAILRGDAEPQHDGADAPYPTYLLTWNPTQWAGPLGREQEWSCGRNRRIKEGDRLFLIRQGSEPRGIVAAGWATSDAYEDADDVLCVRLWVESFLDAECEEIFPRAHLLQLNEGLAEPMKWGVQISGTRIPAAVAERLEVAWREFLSGRLPPTDEVRQASLYHEGAVRQIAVNAYERSPEARRKCIEHYGPSCAVCGMSFCDVYGPLAEGFIHVHHLKPLSEVNAEYVVDPVADLRPVCPNCHAVLHLNGHCRSIAEVRQILKQQKQSARASNPVGE